MTAAVFGLLYLKTGIYGEMYLPSDVRHFVLNLALLQYVGLQQSYSFNGPAWIISIVFWVDMLFGLILAWRPRLLVPIAACVAAAATGVLLFVIREWSAAPVFAGWLEPELLRATADFFVGVLVYRAWCRRGRANGYATAALVVGAAVTIAVMSVKHMAGAGAYMEMASALGGGSLLIWGCMGSRRAQIIGGSAYGRWFGEISYSVFMWHFPIAVAFTLLGASQILGTGLMLLISYLFCVVVIARASFLYLEMPAQDWVPRTCYVRDAAATPL